MYFFAPSNERDTGIDTRMAVVKNGNQDLRQMTCNESFGFFVVLIQNLDVYRIL